MLHKCDVRHCVNPDHLFLGTDADNAADRHRKGRDAHQKGEAHGRSKLTDQQVRQIRDLAEHGAAKRALGRRFGVSHTLIRYIVDRTNWRHL